MLIVLADKDPYDLQALQAGLSSPDREVLILPDGENIVTLAAERTPDVIVMGSSLGTMGGFAVCRDIKLHTEGDGPRMVILLERDADAWLAGWAKADAHMTKPIDVAALDALITGLVGQPA